MGIQIRTPITKSYLPSSYALVATLATIWAEMFLIIENGGYINPCSKFSFVTSAVKGSAVIGEQEKNQPDKILKAIWFVSLLFMNCIQSFMLPTYRLLEAFHHARELLQRLPNPNQVQGKCKHCLTDRTRKA